HPTIHPHLTTLLLPCLSTHASHPFFFSITRPPPTSTLFPYTTLFRSHTGSKPNRSMLAACAAPASRDRATSRSKRLEPAAHAARSEEHTSELQSPYDLVCRLLLEKKKKNKKTRQ